MWCVSQESDDADGADEASKRSVIWLMHWLEQEYDEKKVPTPTSMLLASKAPFCHIGICI